MPGNFTVIPTDIADVKLVECAAHRDSRGVFCETYSDRLLHHLETGKPFVQDNLSVSNAAGVVRGMHFQRPPHAQGKLVRCIRGAILDVAVDLRRGSATFGKHVALTLTDGNHRALWVPEGFAHGFCTLSPDTAVFYKVTSYYEPSCDLGLSWNDPMLGIRWPIGDGDAILSEKDRRHGVLSELPDYFG